MRAALWDLFVVAGLSVVTIAALTAILPAGVRLLDRLFGGDPS